MQLQKYRTAGLYIKALREEGVDLQNLGGWASWGLLTWDMFGG